MFVPLCFRWLLVDACSAAHASLGTESQSHAISLVFLGPAQQLQNSVHNFGIPYLYPFSSMSSYFQSFPQTFKPLPAHSSFVQSFLLILSQIPPLYEPLQTFPVSSNHFQPWQVIPRAIGKILKIYDFWLFKFKFLSLAGIPYPFWYVMRWRHLIDAKYTV